MFLDMSGAIAQNPPRLHYGVAVADLDGVDETNCGWAWRARPRLALDRRTTSGMSRRRNSRMPTGKQFHL